MRRYRIGPGIGGGLPRYLLTTRNNAMIAAWFALIEWRSHIDKAVVWQNDQKKLRHYQGFEPCKISRINTHCGPI